MAKLCSLLGFKISYIHQVHLYCCFLNSINTYLQDFGVYNFFIIYKIKTSATIKTTTKAGTTHLLPHKAAFSFILMSVWQTSSIALSEKKDLSKYKFNWAIILKGKYAQDQYFVGMAYPIPSSSTTIWFQ